jgi:hypothetical protein
VCHSVGCLRVGVAVVWISDVRTDVQPLVLVLVLAFWLFLVVLECYAQSHSLNVLHVRLVCI